MCEGSRSVCPERSRSSHGVNDGMPTFRLEAGGQGATRTLAERNTVLTTADLARLNEQVDSWRRLPEDVARDCLESRKLLAPSGE